MKNRQVSNDSTCGTLILGLIATLPARRAASARAGGDDTPGRVVQRLSTAREEKAR